MQGDFFLTQWVFLGMRWLFENLTGENIALTVVISTLLIRAITVFGDIKSRKSSLKMQGVQPQLDRIRKKYEKDPEKMNRETQKVMRENGVSMFGGCLPMLITMPLFFVFIAAFRQWGNEMLVRLIVTLEENEEAGIEMFKNFRFLWVNNIWMADSGTQPVVMTAQNFLAKANNLPRLLYFKENPAAAELFTQLGFFIKNADGTYAISNIAEMLKAGGATETLANEIIARYNDVMEPCINLYAGHNNGWFIFPLLCGGTTWLSTWVMQRNQPQSDATASSNKMMQYLMPAMTFFFCLSTNAAFALYWTISNLVSMVTTFFINRAFAKQQKKTVEGEAE